MSEFIKSITQKTAILKLDFPETAIVSLEKYFNLLIEEREKYNLIGSLDHNQITDYLFMNSLMFFKYFPGEKNFSLLDIGSGAGFPGLVLKAVSPSINLTLLDSSMKKINFLKLVCDHLSIDNVNFINQRAEDAGREPQLRETYDFVTGRAVASLPVVLELCAPFVSKEGKVVLWKGEKYREEMEELGNSYKLLGLSKPEIVRFDSWQEDNKTSLIIFNKTNKTPKTFPRKFAAIKRNSLRDLK